MRLAELTISDFSGGLRQTSNPLLLSPGVSPDLHNVDCRQAPILTSAGGRTAFSSDPGDTATLLAQFRRSDGYYELLRALGSTGMVQRWGGSAWENVSAMTAYVPIYAVTFPAGDYIILGDGVLMKKYNGTTFENLGGTAPALTCLEVWLSKLWGVRERIRVDFSATGDPTDFTTSNDAGYFMLDNSGGNAITALRVYRGKLYIWTQGALYVVLGTDYFTFEPTEVHPTAGCWSHFAIAEASGFLYWLGPGGVWEYYPGTEPRLISKGWLDDIVAGVDLERVPELCAGSDGVRVYFSLPSRVRDAEVVFDTRYRSFWAREGRVYHRYLWWRRP